MNAMLGIGLLRKRLGDSIVTIEFTGRKSGKQYQLPVGQREAAREAFRVLVAEVGGELPGRR